MSLVIDTFYHCEARDERNIMRTLSHSFFLLLLLLLLLGSVKDDDT